MDLDASECRKVTVGRMMGASIYPHGVLDVLDHHDCIIAHNVYTNTGCSSSYSPRDLAMILPLTMTAWWHPCQGGPKLRCGPGTKIYDLVSFLNTSSIVLILLDCRARMTLSVGI